MNSEMHRDTLEAMGFTLYAARYPLPGAAASPPLPEPAATVESAPAEQELAGPVAATYSLAARSAAAAPGAPAEARRRPPGPTPAIEPAADSAPTPESPGAGPVASFTVAAVALGGCLWLEELPDGVLAQDQVRLIRAICRAFGWSTEPVAVNQFAWPMHRNPQLDQSGDAALAALSAFIHRQMESSHCARLVLLGQQAADRLGALTLETPVVQTQATRDMLRDPLLKRDAWRDLHRL